jgi:penicillin amidase
VSAFRISILVVLLIPAGLSSDQDKQTLVEEMQAALPVLDGDVQVAGLSAPVTVRRDAHGVPHIDAANEDDLLVAQGYVTAQDRLWQMDVTRRYINGELAEVFGPLLVKDDKAQRVLQFHLVAQRIYANLPAAGRARLAAYASGVNLFIAQHPDSLPAEFKLLFYRPKPWSGVDSLSMVLILERLDTHWDVKLAREQIAAKLHDAKLEADLYPVGSRRDRSPTGAVAYASEPRDNSRPSGTSVPEGNAARAHEDARDFLTLRSLLGLPACAGCAPGSNNWVVAGAHTAGGRPLLSNDMHVPLSEPDLWYTADLRAPGYHVAGITLPGVPFVIAGHNEHIAWGFTALHSDVQDLYVEKFDGKGNYQALDGSWKPLAVDHEVIHVRGGKDVELDVQSTAHGPLLNPIFARETRPIALQWNLYDPAFSTQPLYELNVASNWAEFSAALRAWCWPTLNVVYADDAGHSAYHAAGRVPLRPGGLAGVPIQDGAHEWHGYIPFDAMPSSVDPPSGFLATANSRVTAKGSPYPLSLEWLSPYRVERIDKALQGRDHLTAADMLAVQTDVYSEVDQALGHRFAQAIDHTPGTDERLRKAAELMRSWDGRLTTVSAAASLVTKARAALWPLILEPKLGKEAAEYRWDESNYAEEEIIMHASSDWLPAAFANWDALLTEGVRRGMEEGKAPAEVSLWSYGSWHVVDIRHPLATYLPLLGRLTGTGPQPLSGDDTTVKQVDRAYGPSQRFTMDWSNIDDSTENIVLGESGNPVSPYYHDQWNDYYGGTSFALPFTSTAVAGATRHTLRLHP